MIKKLIFFLRPAIYIIKLLLYSPKYLYERISSDFKKDLNSKKLKKKFHIVWCAGLPKSGTTLIEDILNELPMVQANNSLLRIYDDRNLDNIHGISEQMFSKFPRNKITFLKTHTYYGENTIKLVNKYNSKIIISLRDIRDVMISRYFHAMNDKNFFQHNLIKNLSFKEGFIKSLKEEYKGVEWEAGINGKFKKPLEYYYKWIYDWQNYAKNNNNCLILWFEEFVQNPKIYIQKIINYLEFDNIDIDKLYIKLQSKRKLLESKSLKENLNQFEPKTFHKGTSEEWKKILDDEILKEFYSILPGSIDEIKYKTKGS